MNTNKSALLIQLSYTEITIADTIEDLEQQINLRVGIIEKGHRHNSSLSASSVITKWEKDLRAMRDELRRLHNLPRDRAVSIKWSASRMGDRLPNKARLAGVIINGEYYAEEGAPLPPEANEAGKNWLDTAWGSAREAFPKVNLAYSSVSHIVRAQQYAAG